MDANECLGMVQNIKLQSFLHGPFVVVAVVVVLLLGLSPRAWIGVRDDVENNLMLKLEGAPVHLTSSPLHARAMLKQKRGWRWTAALQETRLSCLLSQKDASRRSFE